MKKFDGRVSSNIAGWSWIVALIVGLGISWYQIVGSQAGMIYEVTTTLEENERELTSLKTQDQYVINASLSAEIKAIEQAYLAGQGMFDRRADLALATGKISAVDMEIAKFLGFLPKREYQSAVEAIPKINGEMDKVVLANAPVVQPAQASNELPGEGYRRQTVSTSRGNFVVAMVVSSGRLIVDTASTSDCADNCPVLPLAEYVARNGGYAGINGAYFCPPDYARCQGKVNTFDTLAYNGRSKSTLNAGNNVYSVVPIVVSYGTSLSFYSRTLEWGVDSGSSGALANHPLLLRDGNLAFDENSIEEYQRVGKGTKGFVGTKDGKIVIGHVFAATVPEAAETLRTLGITHALNLDGGGSAALYFEGSYRVGPGRALPTALVLVK